LESAIFKYQYAIKVTMQVHRIVAFCAILLMLLMLTPTYNANAQDYTEYKILVAPNNSATWIITKVSDVNAPIDSWENFQTKIFDLNDNAAELTKRPMAIDENSLQINTTVSASSKTTEYMFLWQNFSSPQNQDLSFGDVFAVPGFFMQLYGEASLQINYPPDFSVKTVTPEPNSRDTSMLRWYRTQDLENTPVRITLTPAEAKVAENAFSQQTLLIVAASAVLATVAVTSAFLMLKRRSHIAKPALNVQVPVVVSVETEENKILNLLRAAKGGMRQSDITDQCRFSKAKTSQLLTALEKRGAVTRLKSGRDKIVTLKDGAKEKKQL
jgi:uncharacterized membrane protein